VNGNPREQGNTSPRFSPRFGFAWQTQRRTTIRASYGIFIAPRSGGGAEGYGSAGVSATTHNPDFGTITSAADMSIVQLGLKLCY
jgi:hypothetical protein